MDFNEDLNCLYWCIKHYENVKEISKFICENNFRNVGIGIQDIVHDNIKWKYIYDVIKKVDHIDFAYEDSVSIIYKDNMIKIHNILSKYQVYSISITNEYWIIPKNLKSLTVSGNRICLKKLYKKLKKTKLDLLEFCAHLEDMDILYFYKILAHINIKCFGCVYIQERELKILIEALKVNKNIKKVKIRVKDMHQKYDKIYKYTEINIRKSPEFIFAMCHKYLNNILFGVNVPRVLVSKIMSHV